MTFQQDPPPLTGMLLAVAMRAVAQFTSHNLTILRSRMVHAEAISPARSGWPGGRSRIWTRATVPLLTLTMLDPWPSAGDDGPPFPVDVELHGLGLAGLAEAAVVR